MFSYNKVLVKYWLVLHSHEMAAPAPGKMKEQKAQQFLYPFVGSIKTFPGICLFLPLPTPFLPVDFYSLSLTGQN